MTGPRVHWRGGTLEVRTGRAGLRTTATLLLDDTPVAEGRGLGRVLLPVPAAEEPSPVVLVLAPLPGTAVRTVLLVPRPREAGAAPADDDAATRVLGLATAERLPFDPEPGTLAARVRAVEERHPRLWASRHVVAAVVRVAAGLLGLLVLLQAVVRPVLRWLAGLVPDVDLPGLPLPDLDLPSIPWPDVDLPDLALPGWLAAVLATAEIWGPLLVGLGMAVAEVRRRRRKVADPAASGPGGGTGDDAGDAHRRP
jgi:hypothetical protein